MSEPRQQPKVLLHKQRKGQRSPHGVSAAGSSSHGGAEFRRSVSSPSNSAIPEPPPPPNQPIWYRFRTALTTLLVLNAVLVGYALVRTSIQPGEASKEADHLEEEEIDNEEKFKKAVSEKSDLVDRKREPLKLPEGEAAEASKGEAQDSPKATSATARMEQASVHVNNKLKPSNEEQQELYKWMLAEKRKMKPKTKAEKAQIDSEKALLKDFLRRKGVLDF